LSPVEEAQLTITQAEAAFRQAEAAFRQAEAAFRQALLALEQALASSQPPAAPTPLAPTTPTPTPPAPTPAPPAPPAPAPIVRPLSGDPKTLAISGITEALVDQGTVGVLVGVFPVGTSSNVVINDGLVYLNYLGYFDGNERIERVAAGTDPSHPDSGARIAGSFNNYLGEGPLFGLYNDDFDYWIGTDNLASLDAGYQPMTPAAPAAQPAIATPVAPPAPVAPAAPSTLAARSIEVYGITDELVDQGAFGLLVGVFPQGTSQDVVINDGIVYLNYLGLLGGNETIQRVVAGTDPTDSDSGAFIARRADAYTGVAPLFTLYRDDFVLWTGDGTYDVWVGLFDGFTGYLYKASDVDIITALTTIPASSFSLILTDSFTEAPAAPPVQPVVPPAPPVVPPVVPPTPVVVPSLIEKILAVSGVTDELVDQGSSGLLVGVFPIGTSPAVVINDGLVYLNYLGITSGRVAPIIIMVLLLYSHFTGMILYTGPVRETTMYGLAFLMA